jgi:aminopeptidase-like protein
MRAPIFDAGHVIHARIAALYPICRSISGNGVRQTLAALQCEIPLEVHEVPSGTTVFDWTVPPEWNIRDAWVKNAAGERVVDFRRHNLHVVSYSTPVRAVMPLAELREHLHSLPDQPDAIPYRTAYYEAAWGFCLTHSALQALSEGDYEVCIDSTLAPGSLTYGECVVAGATPDEVLFSAHVCHPSLANDNLSGVAVAVALARWLLTRPERRYTYRFVFAPGTIGAITWLARNERRVSAIKHGLVLSGVGDPATPAYKRSRRGSAVIDRAMALVLAQRGAHVVEDFSPYGYDERQYGSPGFDLPVGRFSRAPYGLHPQYHTSDDDLNFVQPEALADSFSILRDLVLVLEGDSVYKNTQPKGEPQLGRRALYGALEGEGETVAMLWVLNLSDGQHSLLDIAERAGLPFGRVHKVAQVLLAHGLLAPAKSTDATSHTRS